MIHPLSQSGLTHRKQQILATLSIVERADPASLCAELEMINVLMGEVRPAVVMADHDGEDG